MKLKLRLKNLFDVSTPMGIYIVIFVISAVFIVIGNLADGYEGDIPKNVGYSLLATVISSFIIDKANTKKQRDNDKLIAERLLSELSDECEDILSEVVLATQECIGISEDKFSYEEWVKLLFNTDTEIEKHISEINYFTQTITTVRQTAQKTIDVCKHYYNNSAINNELEKNLKRICSLCQSIEARVKSKHYERCISLLNMLRDTIIKQFPNLSNEFLIEYNHDDLSAWE